eukprot:jgi/Mesvir1/6258/Mv11456-RA.4
METKSPLSAEAGGTSSETYFGDLLGLDDYDETQTAKEIRNDAIQLEWPLNSAADIDKLLVGGQAPLNIVAGDLSDGEPSPTSTDHDEEEHDDNKHGGDQPTPISINNTKPASSQVDAATTNKQPDAPTTQPTAVIRMSNASEMVEISRADLAREAFKLEEASLAASALREVNRHMNEEVERLAAQVAIVSGERDDIRTHSEHLGKLLHEARAQLAQAPATSVPVTPSEALRDMRVALPPQEGEDDPSLLQAAMHTSGKLIVGRHGKRLENILQHLRRFGRRNGWLIEPRQLTNLEKIGEGTSSDVFLANFRGTPVAVKSLKASWVEGDGLGSFARELAVVSTVRHPNVLCFMGAVIDVTAVPSCFLVVTEYVCGGTLKQVLHGRPAGTDAGVGGGPRTPPSRRNLSMMTRLEIGIQVAQAVYALHCQDPPVLHRDIKASNVFLGPGDVAKVADFGLSRPYSGRRETMTGETGTYQYMAPEIVRHEAYTDKADVYSFAILLNELLTGHPPYADFYLTPLQVCAP